MSLHKLKNLQLQDVLIKYEALEQEMKVLKLENMEYKNDIDELQERNSVLTEEINSYKEMLEVGQQQYSYSCRISDTFDALSTSNIDLATQIEETEQEITKSRTENMSLKNENKRYRLALERIDAVRQKQEQIYMKNKLKFESKIQELQQENNTLKIELSAMKINILNYQRQPTNDEKQSDPKIPHSKTVRIASTRTLVTAPSTGSYRSDVDELKTPQMFAHTPLSDVNQGVFHFTNLSSSKTMRQISTKSSCDMFITQSTTNVYETDTLSAKLEEIKELEKISKGKESLIDELENEVRNLKKRNHNLRRQLMDKVDAPFQCATILRWFS